MKKLLLWCVMLLASSSLFAQRLSVTTYIPPQGYVIIPQVMSATSSLMPDFTTPEYFGALMEHESCISLTHKRCLNPTAKLQTAKELGVGYGQITKTFRADGTIRFDTLASLRRAYPKELKDLTWETIESRGDLQITAIVLLFRDSCKRMRIIKNDFERLAMCDAMYNGGPADLDRERRICGLTKDCDPQLWFGHVEKYCQKSKEPLYAGRSACDINRHHVRDVLLTRLGKYEKAYAPYKKDMKKTE